MPWLTAAPVNSVPRFENAWMRRSKFPYSVRSSARVIRHAVSIDERRAKFRSDLMSGKTTPGDHYVNRRHRDRKKGNHDLNGARVAQRDRSAERATGRFRRPSRARQPQATGKPSPRGVKSDDGNDHLKPRRDSPDSSRRRSQSPVSSIGSNVSQLSTQARRQREEEDDLDEIAEQDLEELWFPGCHADLGGGWPISADEELPLSHGPLVWMVREAQRAGLDFNREMMMKLKCGEDFQGDWSKTDRSASAGDSGIPTVQVTESTTPDLFSSPRHEKQDPGWASGLEPEPPKQSEFHRALHAAATRGRLHDCLKFKNGLSAMSVISWKMMEYMPFRRMDLQSDGTWAAISFP